MAQIRQGSGLGANEASARPTQTLAEFEPFCGPEASLEHPKMPQIKQGSGMKRRRVLHQPTSPNLASSAQVFEQSGPELAKNLRRGGQTRRVA